MGKSLMERAALGSSLIVLAALLACKNGGKTEGADNGKKAEEKPPATAAPAPTPAPTPTASASAVPSAAPAPVDPVKHYGAEEREETGTVKVLLAKLPVYPEADAATTPLITLSKGTLVNRKARYQSWLLIEYPSGEGQLSPGWILDRNKPVSAVLTNVKPDAGVSQSTLLDAGTTSHTVDASAPVVTPAPSAVIPTPTPSAASSVNPRRRDPRLKL